MRIVFWVSEELAWSVGRLDQALTSRGLDRLDIRAKLHINPVAFAVGILNLEGDRVDAGRQAESAANGHEENVARESIGQSVLPDTSRQHTQILWIILCVDLDVFANPRDKGVDIGFPALFLFLAQYLVEE